MYLCNPRSLNNKIDEFRSVVLQNNYDLCVISESWFKANRPTEFCDIDGYNLFSRSRAERRGGGVAVYVNQCFQTNTIEVDIPDEIEIFWLHIRRNRLPRTVSSIIVGALLFP